MIRILVFLLAFAGAAQAEERRYGDVDLVGLARTYWTGNTSGIAHVMVCNVNGPDGYLSVRSGPGTNYKIRRNLKRLALLTIDTGQRRGRWVRVLTAERYFSTNGWALAQGRSLHVEGWAHDGYLCDYFS